jgi:steroid delta-isomerase-like uncharacterized protein
MPLVGDRLRAKREEIVLEHIDAENRCDYEAALATFERPRYEFVATDEVYEGAEAVMKHWLEFDRAFPDQQDEILAFHHADETVLVEAISRGTHLGPLRGLPPTGRKFELQFACIFVFEGERLVCERVYFDTNTIFEQLGVASSADSLRGRLGTVVNHPVTIGRGVVRRVTGI